MRYVKSAFQLFYVTAVSPLFVAGWLASWLWLPLAAGWWFAERQQEAVFSEDKDFKAWRR